MGIFYKKLHASQRQLRSTVQLYSLRTISGRRFAIFFFDNLRQGYIPITSVIYAASLETKRLFTIIRINLLLLYHDIGTDPIPLLMIDRKQLRYPGPPP
jgi:hypothetical protein